jgi:uncharacterized membrane protein YgdD (TMEM256/DUF423 family)
MTAWNSVILGLAGLLGAAGVGLAAVAAHIVDSSLLAMAATFLVLHAAGAAALTARGPAPGPRGFALLAGATLMVVGAALFAGDLALRALAGTVLLWGTAPIGGTMMIVAWLTVALAAIVPTL